MAQYVSETGTTEYNVNNSNSYYAEQPQDAINAVNGTTATNTATLPADSKGQIYDSNAVGYNSYDASHYNGQDYSQYYNHDYLQQQQQYYDPNQQQHGQGTYDSSYGYYYGQNYDPNQSYDPSFYSNDPNNVYYSHAQDATTLNGQQQQPLPTYQAANTTEHQQQQETAPSDSVAHTDPIAFFDSLSSNSIGLTEKDPNAPEDQNVQQQTNNNNLGYDASQYSTYYDQTAYDPRLYQNDASAYYNYLSGSSDQIYQDLQYYPTVTAEGQQQQQSIIANNENLNGIANQELDPESIFDAIGNKTIEATQKKSDTGDLQLKNSANEKSAEDDNKLNINYKSVESDLTKSEELVNTVTELNINSNLQNLNAGDIEQHKSDDITQSSDLTRSTNDHSYKEQDPEIIDASSNLTKTRDNEAVDVKNNEISKSTGNISAQKEEISRENLVDGNPVTTISQENSSEITTSIVKEEKSEEISNASYVNDLKDTSTTTSTTVSLTKTDEALLMSDGKNILGDNINNNNSDTISKVAADSQENAELYFGETNKGVGLLDGDDQDLFQNTPATNNPYYSDYSYYNGQGWEQQVYEGDHLNYDAYRTQYHQQQENSTNGNDGQIFDNSWAKNQNVDSNQIKETSSHPPVLSLETQTLSTVYQLSDSPVSTVICPDPNCRGENKSNAKFCCECGRPMDNNSSRLDTPTINVSEVPYSQENYNPQTESLHDYYANTQTVTTSPNPYMQPHVGYSTEINQINGGFDSQQNYYEHNQSYSNDTVIDPLQRSRGCPVIAFGFGGHIFTMFPRTVQRFTSTDQSIPITKSAPGAFIIRTLKDIIPLSKLENFPGPLLMDNNKGGVKAKRKEILKYLDLRLSEKQNQLVSHEVSDIEKENTEVSTIWKLLKVMIENDGHLIGNTKVEEAVRNVLIPSSSSNNNTDESTAEFTIPADSGYNTREMAEPIRSQSTSSITYSVNSSSIDKLQELLLKGDRVSAVQLAMRNNLWSHALIIASCVNKDLWKEVVSEFVRQELGAEVCEPNQSNGRESLRVLYSLLSGQGQNAIDQFLPQASLLNRAVPPSNITSTTYSSLMSPSQIIPPTNIISNGVNYTPSKYGDIPIQSLTKWRETVAMVLANRAPGDSQVITALGDTLKNYGWIFASHICYLLSPQTSIHSGIDSPNSRFSLIGNDYLNSSFTGYFRDSDTLHLTEIYEFGLTLNKNNDGGLPFLQAYKLIHAWWLVDCGYVNEARRYCESIANIVKIYTKGSPYFHKCFLRQLKELTQRLLEHGDNVPGNNNESSSWTFAKKMSKPTLDSLWGSLEGKFNQFIAGDTAEEGEKKPSSSIHSQDTVGPFSHFSSITQPTNSVGVPTRSASAAEFRPHIDTGFDTRRSATPNAMPQRYITAQQRRSSTPGAGMRAVNPVQGYNGFSPTNSEGQVPMTPVPEGDGTFQQQQPSQSTQHGYNFYQPSYDASSNYNSSPWWNNNTTTEENGVTEEQQSANYGSGEFISPMGNIASFVPTATSNSVPSNNNTTSNWQDEEDDLGLGNNAFGAKKKSRDETKSSEKDNDNNDNTATASTRDDKAAVQNTEEKKDDKKAGGGGWFGRWFAKKETTTGGGKNANLGEENSFYYDPAQKRWINKNAAPDTTPANVAPPPPPSREKSTSPTHSAALIPPSNRASLPQSTGSSQVMSPPPMATTNGVLTPPPPSSNAGRRSTTSSKRHRPRYVDIMNQPPSN
ncbi:5347_t:CDS:2 [Ambispora gerdemannii]|uniref:Protein transport protein sec16 n=1 Tax=Ambispora gerdemannii TaxID=144530 RepID=A0A9N8W904_9GLOM|nr:5347_t:CDS:2 [Ambispora gerdemannii]